MKEAEIQIGCTYRVSETQGGGTITIKNRQDLSAAFDLYMSDDLWPILLDAEELVRLRFTLNDTTHQWNKRDCKPEGVYENNVCIIQNLAWFSRKHLSFIFQTNGAYGGNSIEIQLETVHQLQQLFQALTGENLPYNEK